jgi:drug/metabolite transporter (DMT)-like permease
MFALMGAMGCFAINDMVLKLTAQRYPLGEVITVRGTIATLLVGAFLVSLGHFYSLRRVMSRIVISRTLLDGIAMVLFTTALVHMPLAELSAINLVSPLLITAAAVVFFREEVGWRRWTAIVVGSLGTLLIIKPTPGGFNAWALLGIATAFAGVARDMITRQLDAGVPSVLISFLAALASMLIGPLMGIFEEWRPMALFDVGMLAISASFVASGHFFVVVAFRGTVDVAAIAPFRYTLLIFAGLCGYLAFGEVPDRYAIIGSLLIVCSGLYALHREVVRRRAVSAGVPPGEPGS